MSKLYKITCWSLGKKYSIIATSDTKFYTLSFEIKNIWELNRYEMFLMSFTALTVESICEIKMKY